ncbi:hypothetical protein BFW01_g12876 [Lasiodiplodia theobromae]|nr:hypothetical protein BFW01_g12876 [Lasiodiplodia theobromae]
MAGTERIMPKIQSESITAKAVGVTKLFEELAGKIDQMSTSEPATRENKPLSLVAQEKQDLLRDFQILNHYLTSVYETLAWEPSTLHIWKDTVLQLALSHEYLMHAVLALSALHFGHMNPSQKEPFTLASIRHQNLAVAQFASHLSDINSDNCHAAVLFASFTFITAMFSFASRHRDGAAGLDDVVQCFVLVQGVNNILGSPAIWPAIASGPIAPLVSLPPPAAPPVGAFADRLKALADIVRPPPMSPGNETAVSSSSSAAVEALQESEDLVVAD